VDTVFDYYIRSLDLMLLTPILKERRVSLAGSLSVLPERPHRCDTIREL
jgi:hypothetical protein